MEVQKKIMAMMKKSICQEFFKEERIEKDFELIEENKEDKEEICKEAIQEFLQRKRIDRNKLKKEKQNLAEMVRILKFKNGISYRTMEKYLEISREKLRKLVYEYNTKVIK